MVYKVYVVNVCLQIFFGFECQQVIPLQENIPIFEFEKYMSTFPLSRHFTEYPMNAHNNVYMSSKTHFRETKCLLSFKPHLIFIKTMRWTNLSYPKPVTLKMSTETRAGNSRHTPYVFSTSTSHQSALTDVWRM